LVKGHLQCIFMQFPSSVVFKILTQELKALYGIPHIIITIDDYHILILTLVIGGENYYCQKLLTTIIFISLELCILRLRNRMDRKHA
jgi:hypothetical protein